MKIIYLITCFIFLCSCVTPKGYVSKFKGGDCAKFNPANLKADQYTESIIFYVNDVGKKYYFVNFTHPKLGSTRTVIPIKVFDTQWMKVSCIIGDI